MYKNLNLLRYPFDRKGAKTTIMYTKLVIALLTINTMQVNASSYAQNVTIRAKGQSFKTVLGAIRKQTGKDFLYNNKAVDEYQKVDMNIKDQPWTSVLKQLLAEQSLTYKVEDNTVLIQKVAEDKWNSTTRRQQSLVGLVKNQVNQPVAGATVSLVGTKSTTATDATGQFRFENAPADGEISVASIGYQTKKIRFSSHTLATIVLEQEIQAIDEVVVVGFGVQKKKDVIGSISTVNGNQLSKRSVPQLSQALTGQMPGVTVIQRSGQPGKADASAIQIRGVGSFGAGTGALILVDGIPTSSFNDIDPNDVASISVLKDASSAAIYGARAANGVILVTTKMGADRDKLSINYSGNFGFQKPTVFPEFVNSWEYALGINETTSGGGGYTEEEIQKFKDGSDLDHYPNSNFFDEVFKSNVPQTSHNINLSNNTERIKYTFSLGYLNQKGVVRKNNYDRFNTRLNLTTNIRENLKLTTRLSAIQTSDKQPSAPATLDFADMGSIISQVIRYPSISPIRLSNGDWGPGNNLKGNPVSFIESDSYYRNKLNEIGGNMRLDWEVIPDLTLSAIGGYTQNTQRDRRFRASQRINSTITIGPATLSQSNPYSDYKTFQALAEYKKSFGKHDVKFLGGYSFEQGYSEGLTAFRQGFPSNSLTELNIGSPEGQKNSGTASEWALESLFGRLQYNFAGKYLLEGVVRYDGSSRFASTKKYAVFPSVAGGWLLSEESFFKDNVTWLSELKLKASYGILGNQNIGNYPYQNILNTGYDYAFGNAIQPGVARRTIIDPTLRWESTRTSDFGVDGSLFSRKLNFSATYYDRYTYDILVSPSASVSKVLGFEVGLQNSGKLKNSGFEFTLGYQDKKGDWTYGATLNFSTVKNEVIDLGVGNIDQPNGMVGNGSSLFIGHPMQVYYGYQTAGLFIDAADVKEWADMKAINPNAQPGDVRYKDISGPDGVPDGKVDPIYDRAILGSRIPKTTYGANFNVGYKNLDLSVLVQGVSGVKGLLDNYAGWALYGNGNMQRWQYEGRWTPENPNRDAEYPRLEQLVNTGSPNTLLSDYWVLDASYLRIKNLQLGYSFPKTLTNSWKIEGLRVFANVENLVTWHNYRKGWDPEINSGGDYYPILRNFSFGVNLNF